LLTGLGAVALAAMLLSLAAPKAVHAIVAALVEVTNTPANPVPTADVHQSAAQNIELYCSAPYVAACGILPQTGGFPVAWVVPSGQNFVITDVEVSMNQYAEGGQSFYSIAWTPPGGTGVRTENWFVPNNGTTTEFQFSNGIVVLPGSTVVSQGGSNVNQAIVRGYLTPY
jgi:hypothetical protein